MLRVSSRHWALGAVAAPVLLPLAACTSLASAPLDTRLPPASARATAPQSRDGEIAAVPKIGRPYEVRGQWYTPADQPDYDETGTASWYGEAFQGLPTANGEVFDMNEVSAAHKTLPLPSLVEVTNLDNGKRLTVRVNDRGPFVDGRIIDLSKQAADELGVLRPGLARVRVRYIGAAPAVTETQIAEARGVPRRPGVPAPVAVPATPPMALPPPQPDFQEVQFADAPADGVLAANLADDPVPASQPGRPPSAVAVGQGWAVQAGTWPELGGAEQAARRLTSAGAPQIRLIRQDGAVVYQVVIIAPDQAAAAALQRQVITRGFSGAKVLRP